MVQTLSPLSESLDRGVEHLGFLEQQLFLRFRQAFVVYQCGKIAD